MNGRRHGRCKTGEHVIRSGADLRGNGRCAECCRRNERNYRRSCVEARRKLREMESQPA